MDHDSVPSRDLNSCNSARHEIVNRSKIAFLKNLGLTLGSGMYFYNIMIKNKRPKIAHVPSTRPIKCFETIILPTKLPVRVNEPNVSAAGTEKETKLPDRLQKFIDRSMESSLVRRPPSPELWISRLCSSKLYDSAQLKHEVIAAETPAEAPVRRRSMSQSMSSQNKSISAKLLSHLNRMTKMSKILRRRNSESSRDELVSLSRSNMIDELTSSLKKHSQSTPVKAGLSHSNSINSSIFKKLIMKRSRSLEPEQSGSGTIQKDLCSSHEIRSLGLLGSELGDRRSSFKTHSSDLKASLLYKSEKSPEITNFRVKKCKFDEEITSMRERSLPANTSKYIDKPPRIESNLNEGQAPGVSSMNSEKQASCTVCPKRELSISSEKQALKLWNRMKEVFPKDLHAAFKSLELTEMIMALNRDETLVDISELVHDDEDFAFASSSQYCEDLKNGDDCPQISFAVARRSRDRVKPLMRKFSPKRLYNSLKFILTTDKKYGYEI